jgi:tRNA threonylcarbamoyladenosine biosynthesis protein TsaB
VILALDTSTAIAGLALYDGRVAGEITWYSGRNHSVELMPQVEALMRLKGVHPSHLEAIAAATGPGSYTGLRVGLSAAKGLCLSLEIPMVGVPTLDVLAEPHRETGIPVMAVLDAGRRRYATAVYDRGSGEFGRSGSIIGMRAAEIVAALGGEILLCGDLEELRGIELPAGVRLASPASSLRRAGFLAEIAWRRYRAGEAQDPKTVEAFYLGREDS